MSVGRHNTLSRRRRRRKEEEGGGRRRKEEEGGRRRLSGGGANPCARRTDTPVKLTLSRLISSSRSRGKWQRTHADVL